MTLDERLADARNLGRIVADHRFAASGLLLTDATHSDDAMVMATAFRVTPGWDALAGDDQHRLFLEAIDAYIARLAESSFSEFEGAAQ